MIIQVRTRTNFAVLASSAFHHGMLQPGHPVPKKPDFVAASTSVLSTAADQTRNIHHFVSPCHEDHAWRPLMSEITKIVHN
jgi:hypothetical protein